MQKFIKEGVTMEEWNVIDDMVKMDLHEVKKVNAISSCMRVVGGWVYTIRGVENGRYVTSVFVPFADDEERARGRRMHITV
jgi:hypothetical protein